SANSFDELYHILQEKYSYIDHIHLRILEKYIAQIQPKIIAFTVPFPGNLYSAFRAAQWLKKHFPSIKTMMGGGFANTELRNLSDPRVFEFFDFITLDDGEAPIENLIEHIKGKRNIDQLKRTFALVDQKVKYINKSESKDYKQSEVGTPDYSDLWLEKYISVIEIVNPMHRMWSDGRWNKFTMAHGCYWGKCTFCDISLDYIKIYEPVAAKLICDRIEELIEKTGQNGFHFVDEAAPPALMRALALEIIRRKLTLSWWTNIRFEKSFSADLCKLLAESGCIAVSGGLEVASDRLLELIQKGVTVAQVAKVCRNFTESGIMVHAYLMYGFPTQTAQETIDSLEMVRQMFELGVLQSGFWHQFAMTAHSPVGMYPEKFGVKKENDKIGTFANNDLVHSDPTGADHDLFSYGLKKSLFNFMYGIGFENHLQFWFDFDVPKTKIPRNYIKKALQEDQFFVSPRAKIVWIGAKPQINYFTKSKKGNFWEMANVLFYGKKENFSIQLEKKQGIWLTELLDKISVKNQKLSTFEEIKKDYENNNLPDFELFWYNKPVNLLNNFGLLVL
ncbi:MAG: radical SAM protein, partial [Bacteroidetes bacterium]